VVLGHNWENIPAFAGHHKNIFQKSAKISHFPIGIREKMV
jgi:hypothetical protein